MQHLSLAKLSPAERDLCASIAFQLAQQAPSLMRDLRARASANAETGTKAGAAEASKLTKLALDLEQAQQEAIDLLDEALA